MVCLRRVGLNRATLGSYVTDIPRVTSRACQGGESNGRFTSALELAVVNWLQVSSDSFLEVK